MTSAVLNLVKQIQRGKVATYGQIAKKAGLKSARTVGQIIHKNIHTKKILATEWSAPTGRLQMVIPSAAAQPKSRN